MREPGTSQLLRLSPFLDLYLDSQSTTLLHATSAWLFSLLEPTLLIVSFSGGLVLPADKQRRRELLQFLSSLAHQTRVSSGLR